MALHALLAANHRLLVVHGLRDGLEDLWAQRPPELAAQAWNSWHRKALRSGIESMRRFAQNLSPYLPGVLAHRRCPLGTHLIRGMNNKIERLNRRADGFRDDAYFFLKIRAAFPGGG